MPTFAALRVAPFVALVAGALLGCFQADVFLYTPCESSDSCAEAGLLGCLRLPDDAAVRGSCTQGCGGRDGCPSALSGDASARCAEVDGTQLCVLSCMDERTCPEGQVCKEVAGVDGEVGWLCFPEAAP